jgi:hypothetical protein
MRACGVRLHFFTHALVAESHFMSVSFLHSALVFGGSAANAGAAMPNRRPATIAVLRILDILFPSERGLFPQPSEGCALLVAPTCPQLYRSVNADPANFWNQTDVRQYPTRGFTGHRDPRHTAGEPPVTNGLRNAERSPRAGSTFRNHQPVDRFM